MKENMDRYTIRKMAELLGVSRNAYYRWMRHDEIHSDDNRFQTWLGGVRKSAKPRVLCQKQRRKMGIGYHIPAYRVGVTSGEFFMVGLALVRPRFWCQKNLLLTLIDGMHYFIGSETEGFE
ncbi:MAG: hypothetical protein LBC70_02200 [Chitinispirillales bacterium]|jgi:hypothetical protein|nr:hypothetical protein [Chitinispirillales bacterium]